MRNRRSGCCEFVAGKRALSLVVISLLAVLFMGQTSAAPRKVRVSDPALAESLIANGGKLIADYGAFKLLETEQAGLNKTEPDSAEAADEFDFIQLNAQPLNTRAPEVRALRKSVGVFSGRRLHLVHFAGPVKPDWRSELEMCGAQIITYIPQNAYLVYGDAAALRRVQDWAAEKNFVQWEGDYADEHKIHPRARVTDEKGNPQNPSTDTFAIQLVEDAEANGATRALIHQLKLAPIKNEFRTLHYLNIIVRLPPGQLTKLAARPEVVSIQPYLERHKMDERQNQIVAGNLSGTSPNGPGYLAWLAGKGFTQAQFTASGFAVDVTDSGIDNGTTAPGHFGLYQSGDLAQSSRVIYNRLEGSPNAGNTLQGCDGHGNLNSHIVAGFNDRADGFPHTDASGFHYGLGVCPFVKVGSSVIFDPNYFTSPNYANLQSDAYHDGARVSANSWGADTTGAYDVDAQSYDALVRDAQPAGSTFGAAGNQEMVIVFAAGNAGPGAQSIGSPGTAKNVITVGAAENVHSHSSANGGNTGAGNDGCATPDSEADNADDIASFSSRGPCSDGRMKPEIVAPGTHITGGVGQGSTATNGNGSAISCFVATGVCALPGGGTNGSPANFFPLGQQFYTTSSGTSHSTPAVAGACALLRQHFINNGLMPPSAAMTKAFLVNSARHLNGVDANDSLWSPNQGMGEVNLGAAFDGAPRFIRDQASADKFTATGQTRAFTGVIADPTRPFRVTLAWTDAPGNTTGNAFNNDLDLTVTIGGNTYKGNVFSGASSTTGGIADKKNNVESVFLPAGLTGVFTVTVTAANINSDGVPNEAPSLDQDFALVAYNAGVVIAADSSTLEAEGWAPANNAIDPGETVTVNFALKNVGTANTTNLVATLLATNGVIALSGAQTYGVLTNGGVTVSRPFSFTASGACSGTITAVFQLQDGAVSLGTVSQTLKLGVTTTTTTSFTNANSISIPLKGKASHYPSAISVSGVTGTVSKVSVTLRGVSHSFPDDVDALLVGPGGQTVMLMSDCGDWNGFSGVTLTFDDGGSALPDSSLIVSGVYASGNFDSTSDIMPLPAPSSPYGQALSAFNGLNPNGTWSLYIQDDASQDNGSVAQGWMISITTSTNTCCTSDAPGNVPPTLAPIDDQTIQEMATLVLTNSAIDPDSTPQPLAYTLVNAPVGATINSTNGVFAWTPAEAPWPGTNTITVRVTDGGSPPLSDIKTFTVIVSEINEPPTLALISDMTITEGTTLLFTCVAADPDVPANALSFSFDSTPPDGATLDATTGVLSWTPGETQSGSTNIFTVRVTDSNPSAVNEQHLSDAQTFAVVVVKGNQPPALAPMAARAIHAGTTLVLTNAATDPDIPINALAFSLDAGAPAGAAIDPASGVFSWTPDSSFANTTNPIIVRVSDDGAPAMSGATTFNVTVLPPPLFQGIFYSNDVVTMTWSAIAGQTYRVLYKEDMNATNWSNLLPDVTASGETASRDDVIVIGAQRYYRILVR